MSAAKTQTVDVPHLGGISAGYRLSSPSAPGNGNGNGIDPAKPTLVLINSFMTSAALFAPQFDSPTLSAKVNLLAIEPLGHGLTRLASSPSSTEHFTYWDSAVMNLQVMDALGVRRAFVLGTSQGGWVAVRMALLAPERILGIVPLGSSMDAESPRSIDLGCWDGHAVCSPPIADWSVKPSSQDADADKFVLDDAFCTFLLDAGFGPASNTDTATDAAAHDRATWTQRLKTAYAADAGRRRARMCAINLRDRDGLHGRVPDVTCPVLWMHGTADAVYSVANAREEIGLFTGVGVQAEEEEEGGSRRRLVVVEGGQHFLSASKPAEVEREVLPFVEKYWKVA